MRCTGGCGAEFGAVCVAGARRFLPGAGAPICAGGAWRKAAAARPICAWLLSELTAPAPSSFSAHGWFGRGGYRSCRGRRGRRGWLAW